MELLRKTRAADPDAPLAPFDGWAVQLHEPEYGFFWYLPEHVALVSQLLHTNVSPARVHILQDRVDDLLGSHGAAVDAAGGFTFLHDWRRVRTYDPGTRSAFLGRVRRRGTSYVRRSCFVLADHPLARLAGAVLGASHLIGLAGSVEIASDPHDALRRYGLTTPTTTRWPAPTGLD